MDQQRQTNSARLLVEWTVHLKHNIATENLFNDQFMDQVIAAWAERCPEEDRIKFMRNAETVVKLEKAIR